MTKPSVYNIVTVRYVSRSFSFTVGEITKRLEMTKYVLTGTTGALGSRIFRNLVRTVPCES